MFVTVSPNRRMSGLIMRLSRIRPNDSMANAALRSSHPHVKKRVHHAGPSSPSLYTEFDDERDLEYLFTEYADMSTLQQEEARERVERKFVELEMPNVSEKQAWNAEDPLASVHNYLVNMRVNLPLLYGLRALPTCYYFALFF